MKLNESEVKSLIAEQIWEALEKARFNGEEASDYEVVCEDGEITFQRANLYNNWDALVSAESMADMEEYSDKECVEAWVENIIDPQAIREIMLKLRTIEETESIAELQDKAESVNWWHTSEEESHTQMMAMLKHGISLLSWNLDTVEANCSELNEIARFDRGEIFAMFTDSEEGGPLPREKADTLLLHVGGLDLCGPKYGTKYNDDGATVLNWIEQALNLPLPAHEEYQDGWHEEEWNLADIEK